MDSATESGGRVTRALRKRLTSIDSDNGSSRPGTPVQSKLAAATTNSPLKPRMTRRHSTSGVGTPVKTPGKRVANAVAAIAEEVNVTPARRSTRRRSSSQIENEATPKLDMKTSHFESLAEEQVSTRVTRSKSKSPEQAVGKISTGGSQRVRRSNLRNQTVIEQDNKNDGELVDHSEFEGGSQRVRRSNLRNQSVIEQDNKDVGEPIVVSNKNEKDESNSSPTKRKSLLTENNNDKKILNNRNDELVVELNSSTEKRKSLLTDVNNEKKKLNNLSDSNMSLSTSPIANSKLSERNDDGDKISASPQMRKSLSIGGKAVVEVEDDKNVKSNSDNEKTNVSPSKLKTLANSVTAAIEKPIDVDELSNISISIATNAHDGPNTSIKSVATTSRDVPKETNVGDEKSTEIQLIGEQKPNTQLNRQALLNTKSPVKDNDHNDEHEMDIDISKPDANNTIHADVPSPSVKEEPVEVLNEIETANMESITVENNNTKFIITVSSEAPSPKRADDIQKEPEDVNSTNPNEPVKLAVNTSIVLSTGTITPARNGRSNSSTEGNSLKRVGFSSNISDDECEKSIYPKTPGSAKSKSFMESNSSRDDDKSFQAECTNNDSVVILNDTTDVEIPETQQEEITSCTGGNKTIADDDTVVSIVEDNASSDMEKITCLSQPERKEEGDKSIVEELSGRDDTEVCEKSIVQDSPGIKLRWYNPSVVAKGTKLDTITNDGETVDKSVLDNDKFIKQKKKKKNLLKRAEWNDDEESPFQEDDDDEYLDEEEEGEEKQYARKHSFHDDEVMVVDDYESGDSMDSEEREEIKQNEIPVDGESIGSHTTDEENDNVDDESDNDSFIVSDNCEEEDLADFSRSEYDDDVEVSNDVECIDREKKKKYKRLQRVNDTSSSDDDEPPKENFSEAYDESENTDSHKELKLKANKSLNSNSSRRLKSESEDESDYSNKEDEGQIADAKDVNKSTDTDENLKLKVNKSFNSSRLSDSARRLQSDAEDESDSSNKDALNMSRKEILRKLNQSDRFNKSVRDLNPEVDLSPDALATANTKNISLTSANTNATKYTEQSVACEEADSAEEEPTSTSNNVCVSDLHESKKMNRNTSLSSKHSESHLGEVSVTSEEENSNDDGGSSSDGDEEEKENAVGEQVTNAKENRRGLSVSFGGNFKQQKTEIPLQKKLLQRSFTIGVSINGGELETEVLQNKATKSNVVLSSSSPSASLSSNEDTDGDVLSSDDVRFLENIKHMPLGNPLVRTRRQSLALPTNPDMEIGSTTKNNKRKSLAVLSGNEFNPSQSFVDSLEIRKAELDRQTSKRKRLSKSFCGTAADNSVIDIDVRHLHKRSKMSSENSFAESFENTKPDNSMCLKAAHSSTPHEKGSAKKHNNSGIRRILNRCDEILEAANRAKLEAKLNYRKSKVRIPKKNKKRMQRQASSPESKRDKVFAPITKEIKKRDKAKIAVTQALKASADIIIGKQRTHHNAVACVVSNRLPSDVLKTAADSQSTTKKNKKEHLTEQNVKYRNYCTAAGNVVEMLQSPERKKKSKIIRLPTGRVCVEPMTPTKRSILTCNGMEFHESPMTPCAVGFKVREVLSSNGSNCLNKDRKRKRSDEGRKHTLPTPQWTQSGLFIEEEIQSDRPPHSICHGRIAKRVHLGQHQANNSNFKLSALHRGDIKRSTAREILQLRERRQMHD